MVKAGAMGENVAQATLKNYIDSVNEPAQRLFESNLAMLFREFIRTKMNEVCTWNLMFENIDLTDKMALARVVPRLVQGLLLNINEGRRWLGEKTAGKWADHFYINHPQLGFIQVDTPDGQATKSMFTADVIEALAQVKQNKVQQYFDFASKKKLSLDA
jgi:hypothetical protein